MSKLEEKRCVPCEGGVPALDAEASNQLLKQLGRHWSISADNTRLAAEFEFKNYYHTTAFVNALIYIAHREDHHPDVSFGYKNCRVEYSTHAIGGLTENDFICAAKIDALRED